MTPRAVAPVGLVDRAVGGAIERSVVAHHRRRLRRRGAGAAFDPPAGGWAATGAFPPRGGCSVELLVDGAEILPRMVADVEAATSHVHLAGWAVTPTFAMGTEGRTLRGVLAEAARRVDVRVLVWAGAPLPFFRPHRSDVRAMREELTTGTRIAMELDARERPFHCHHEKLVVVDDRVAYVGGLDLTTFGGNRLDTSDHPPRIGIGWHDACLRVEGPVAGDVARHFALRWPARLPEPDAPGAAGATEAQLVRTVPEHVYSGLPRGEFSILESFLRAFRAARRFVYLESQFLWSPELVAVLAAKLREPPADDFRLVVLLPAHPRNGADDTRGQLGVLADAAAGGGDPDRFLACTLYQVGGGPVYVHAKVAVVDDEWLTVGSANLNEHSLFNDTEANVVVRDPALVAAARVRLWSEHLERDVSGDPVDVLDRLWRPRASSGEGKLRLLRGVSRRARALLGPVNGLLVDG
ncbi:MAG TPA: phospholipase D family protein [Gaiellaceae bacterium]|nr:phospholipase D family protein [Gaiellaceae bacterium]